jgi:hypothetical protein
VAGLPSGAGFAPAGLHDLARPHNSSVPIFPFFNFSFVAHPYFDLSQSVVAVNGHDLLIWAAALSRATASSYLPVGIGGMRLVTAFLGGPAPADNKPGNWPC